MDSVYGSNIMNINLPTGWTLERLKFICKNITDGSHFSPTTTKEGKHYITVSDVYDGKVNVDNSLMISEEDFSSLVKAGCQPPQGSVLLSKDGTVGRTAIVSDNDYVVLSSLGILTPGERISSRFLKYSLDSLLLQEQMKKAMAGSALRRITIAKINELVTVVPPLKEQEAIASYLDNKVSSIDTIIKKAVELKSSLDSYRRSFVSECVTRGIAPNRALKPTGVIAFPEIPNDWEAIKIKYTLVQNKDGIKIGPFGSSLTNKVSDNGLFKVYGQWNIVDGNFLNGKNYVQEDTFNDLIAYEVIPGDILVSMMGTIGKCTIIPEGIQSGIMDSHVIKIRLNQELILSEYFNLVYDKDNSNIVFTQISEQKKGSIMDGLNSTIVKNLFIPLPPIEEQRKIVEAVSERTSIIDKAICDVNKQISALQEYRTSIIYEAITGNKAILD